MISSRAIHHCKSNWSCFPSLLNCRYVYIFRDLQLHKFVILMINCHQGNIFLTFLFSGSHKWGHSNLWPLSSSWLFCLACISDVKVDTCTIALIWHIKISLDANIPWVKIFGIILFNAYIRSHGQWTKEITELFRWQLKPDGANITGVISNTIGISQNNILKCEGGTTGVPVVESPFQNIVQLVGPVTAQHKCTMN